MNRQFRYPAALALSAAVALCAAASLPVHGHAQSGVDAPEVGAVSAAQTRALRAGTELSVADRVFLNDSIATDATGLAQILFADQSSLKLGPMTEVTIDRFIYDPDREGGSAAVIERGLARLIGGRISKRAPMQIGTPHLNAGVRGGVVSFKVDGTRTLACLQVGRMVCAAGGERVAVRRSGYCCEADAQGLRAVTASLADFERLNDQTVPEAAQAPSVTGAGAGAGLAADGALAGARYFCGAGVDPATQDCDARQGQPPILTASPATDPSVTGDPTESRPATCTLVATAPTNIYNCI